MSIVVSLDISHTLTRTHKTGTPYQRTASGSTRNQCSPMQKQPKNSTRQPRCWSIAIRWPGGSRAHTHHTPCLYTLDSDCPLHVCQAVMINAIGGKKSRVFGVHQAATVAEYSKTYARFLAFMKKSGVDVVDAIVEELDGASQCIVTKFLLHEAAHNNRYAPQPYPYPQYRFCALNDAVATGTRPPTRSSTAACICSACGEVRALWCFVLFILDFAL